MTSETMKRFTVINGQKEEPQKRERVTNPINYEVDDLRTKLAKFRNNEGGTRYSVKDLLTW